MRLLIVEDQKDLAEMSAKSLHNEGFAVDIATCLDEASAAIEVSTYAAIILDRSLPDGDSLYWLKDMRARKIQTPVLFMTAEKPKVNDRIEGLVSGGDDYMIKPVDLTELAVRVRNLLRRQHDERSGTMELGNLSVNTMEYDIRIAGKQVTLPRRERSLLEFFLRHPNSVIEKDSLEEKLYGFNEDVTPNAIEVAVHRLRKLLSEEGANVEVKTIRGVGYKIEKC